MANTCVSSPTVILEVAILEPGNVVATIGEAKPTAANTTNVVSNTVAKLFTLNFIV